MHSSLSGAKFQQDLNRRSDEVVAARRTASRYDGPVRTDLFAFQSVTVQVHRPADPDRLLELEDVLEWNRQDDYMPYWAYLWPGAFLLADAVARAPGSPNELASRRVLELGCGLGLAGLVALARGCAVDFTDYDLTPLDFVRQSVLASGLDSHRWRTWRLDWREIPDGMKFDWILGADLLYERKLVPLVVHVIDRLLAPGGVAWLAGPDRSATEDLVPRLDAVGLSWNAEPVETPGETPGTTARGTLHQVRRAPGLSG